MRSCRDENPNATGGSEPASQRGTPPRKRAAKQALLRLLLTPTFVVSAGTVVAAILAYGMTQTHLLFSGLGPVCGTANCSTTAPPGAGGAPMRISATPARGHTGGPGSGGQAWPGGRAPDQTGAPPPDPDVPPSPGHLPPPGGTRPSGSGVSITYQTLSSRAGEFLGAITITNRTRSALVGWRLWLGYREGWIDRLQGARWLPASSHHSNAGLAAARPGQVLPPAASVRITVWVHGQASEPSTCIFNGTSCGYSGAPG